MFIENLRGESILLVSIPKVLDSEELFQNGLWDLLTVIDEYNRESLAIEVAQKLNSQDVLQTLARLFIRYGTPEYIRSDNGPELTAKGVRKWLNRLM